MKTRLTMPRLMLLLAEVIAFAILALVASNHFGMSEGIKITLSYLVAYVVPRIVLERSSGNSMTAMVILFLLMSLLMFVGVSNLLEWTSAEGYSLEMPNIKGDARGYYKWALHNYDGRVPFCEVAFPGFPLMMVYIWRVLGVSVIWPLAMNTMFLMLSVVLTGLTARRLLIHRTSMSSTTLVSSGMMLTCLLCFYLIMGISILKEATVFMSVALAGYVLSSMSTIDDERHYLWRDIALFILACILLAMVRTTYLYIILIGVIVMAIPHWRRDWVVALVMVAIIAVSLFVGDHYAAYSFDRHAEIVGGGWNMQRFFLKRGTQQPYQDLMDFYFLYSPLHRFLMLPLTMSFQFILPLPWMMPGDDSTVANYVCRITYGWYLIGGIALFYYLFLSWRRSENMGAWAWWPGLVFIALAYIVAGTANRYLLPIEPLFVPVVLFVIDRLREGRWLKAFKRWAFFFVILTVVALLLGLEIDRETFSQFFHTTPLKDYLRR